MAKQPDRPQPVEQDEEEVDAERSPFRGSRLFKPGTKVGAAVVLGQDWHEGRLGPIGNRRYRLKCLAPTGEKGAECGREFPATYHQLYMGRVESCGCAQRQRRPHQRLDHYKVGTLEVLGWDEERRLWEVICHICGSVIYRKTKSQIDKDSDNCAPHLAEARALAKAANQ